ncbi:putative purine permease 4-like [Capsicum annuum]|uniref:uncharacterized protein LOC107845900 n=1 Tax=Capsicum annuum TaxID=4072 RepID=UPI001FB0D75F|nr:uncharacterized protein LOC107845900 [Capsicum annuum]KAF3632569.1 putative purine permease 4-like [Capsicum annuum]
MASSQVEIASSSPFGYVVNNRCCVTTRDSNTFSKNFKNLVQYSHLHSCISNQSKKTFVPDSCENSQNNGDLCVHKTEFIKNDTSNASSIMVFSMDKENQESSSIQVSNLDGGGGVSSLVRKWKGFETDSKSESSLFVGIQECDESCSVVKVESFGDCDVIKQSDNKTDDVSKDCDVKESERLGVADIIKKLKFDNGNVVSVNGGSLPRVRTTTMDHHSEQQRCNFSPVLSSPRFIRGRQAFSDLLMQMERDRQREIEGLVERKAVSKFQQKGRIQALLRVRLIRHGAEVRGGRTVHCSASESNKSTHSSIMHLRKKFNTVGQHGVGVSRNTSKELAESKHESGSLPSTPNQQQKENSHQDFKSVRGPQRELARSNSAKAGTGFSLYQQREEDPLKGLLKERERMQLVVADSINTSIASGDNIRDTSLSKKGNHHKPRSPHKEVADNKPKVETIVTSNPLQEKNRHEEAPDQVSPRNVATSIHVRNMFPSHQQRERDHRLKDLVRDSIMQPGLADSRSTPKSGENARDSCRVEEESHHKPRNPHKEVVDNIPKVRILCISNQLPEVNHYEELCKKLSSRKVATSIPVTNLAENQKEMARSTKKSEGSCRLNEHDMDLKHQEVNTSLPRCTSQAKSFDNIPEKASWENKRSEASHSNLLDFVEIARPFMNRGESKQLPWTCNEWSSICTNPQSGREEEATNKCLVESYSGSVSEYSLSASGWDELQSNYQQDNEDWISNISRPRKEWEGLRQERYQEMLDPFSDNHDLQQLLHRKTVSMFLNSALREEIDRIMASRSQQLPKAMSSHVEEEISAQAAEEEEEVEQNVRKEEDEVGGEEEEEWGYDDDSEDENSPSRQRYNEPEGLIHQNIYSQTSQSWNTNPDQEVTDDSYHFTSPSSLQSQSSNIYSQHIQPYSSSTGHPSPEMELIYEMRGHMEQLHQEIFEIRRSMKSCMNMQIKLQRSIKQDVAAAISQLGQNSIGNSDNKGSNKGNCRICCSEPVDSLLYRCGHMCTCFKCAHELISGTGKCPICQAPIIDVVRAYAHS